MSDRIPSGIQRNHILSAMKEIDEGRRHDFGPSTAYDILYEGKRYPPKAVVGLAAEHVLGEPLGPNDFKGGLKSKCFSVLIGLGFSIVPKPIESTEIYEVLGLKGDRLDAHFSLERNDQEVSLVFESRGGSRGGTNERNFDYASGLSVLLARLGFLGLSIEDAVVDSAITNRMGLTREERRLCLTSFDYPIQPARHNDLHSLRSELCAAQRPIGRRQGARGSGNNTKRIRLYLELPETELDIEILAQELAGWATPPLVNPETVDTGETVSFDPTDLHDARQKVISATVQRQGQQGFRSTLIAAYGGRCAITGCDVLPVLEAAHISPYRGSQTNHVQNGLLLRADVHLLFDRGLIGIETTQEPWTVLVSTSLLGSDYGRFDGSHLELPQDDALRPHKEALLMHRRSSGL